MCPGPLLCRWVVTVRFFAFPDIKRIRYVHGFPQCFVESYRAKYDTDPNHWAAQSYAALNILATTIADAGSTDPKAIRGAMGEIRGLETILGQFSLNAEGDAVYDPVVLIVQDGKFEIFE